MTEVIAEIDETRRERRLAKMTRAAKAIDPNHSLDLAEEALPLDNGVDDTVRKSSAGTQVKESLRAVMRTSGVRL